MFPSSSHLDSSRVTFPSNYAQESTSLTDPITPLHTSRHAIREQRRRAHHTCPSCHDPKAFKTRYILGSVKRAVDHMTHSCLHCSAWHWIKKRVKGSSKADPKFESCCKQGAVELDSL